MRVVCGVSADMVIVTTWLSIVALSSAAILLWFRLFTIIARLVEDDVTGREYLTPVPVVADDMAGSLAALSEALGENAVRAGQPPVYR